MEKAVVTCALTGVLTNPADYPAPVTPEEMAREARRAFDEGASVVHVHFRRQEPKIMHWPSWDPSLARAIVAAIRDACPGIIINQTTGVIGDDITGPLKCLAAVRPEIAALNAGSLNYLKTRADGTWAWAPILFDNPVEKIRKFLQSMCAKGIEPEFECFDTGIVRTAASIARNNGYDRPPKYNFVMGVESGMPADPELLPYVLRFVVPGARWSVTAIGRKEIWPLAPARRRARRRSAHRPRGHDLPARRLAGLIERRSRRGARRHRPRSGTRHRLARGGARRAKTVAATKEARP